MKKLKNILLVLAILISVSVVAQDNGLSFDGSDDYVEFPVNPVFNTTRTFEAWIYPTSITGFKTIAEWSDGVDNVMRFYIRDGQLELLEDDGFNGGVVSGTGAILPNQWNHVAFVETATGFVFYIDGNSEDVGFPTGSAGPTPIFNLGSIRVGFNYFEGIMDEVRVWSEELNQTTIQNQRFSQLSGAEANLLAYYQFNESSGTILPDLTTNNIDGTLLNGLTNTPPADGVTNGPLWVASSALPNPFIVTNTNDSGIGSLRWCIENANTSGTPETITFNIPGVGPWVIAPATILPEISRTGVIVDASTQPGWDMDLGLMVTIDGSGFSGTEDGLIIDATDVEIYGLQISNFPDRGLNTNTFAANAIIGEVGRGNVINGNGTRGISIGWGGSRIVGNRIGTNAQGTAASANNFGITAHNGTIITDNLISGNTSFGAWVNAVSTITVQDNLIGTDITGSNAIPNDVGVFLGTTSGNSVLDNVISGNSSFGIQLSLASGTIIQGNNIGVGSNGTDPIGNGMGIYFWANGMNSNLVGGLGAGEANIIANNTNQGVLVNVAAAIESQIIGNSIYANGGKGIDLNGVGNNNKAAPTISDYNSGSVSGTGIDGDVIHIYRDNTLNAPLQGQEYLGTTTVAGGVWTVAEASILPTDLMNATATDAAGNTSEFAINFAEIMVFDGPDNSGVQIFDAQAAVVNVGTSLQGFDLDYLLTIENKSSVSLTINSIFVGGSDFIVQGAPASVAPNSTENFTVRLLGTTSGTFSDLITIDSDDVDEGLFTFDISGEIIANTPFITTWITTDGQITIPTNGAGYNYNVTWINLDNAGVGDGSATGQSGNYIITGLSNGDRYQVSISGAFPAIYFNNMPYASKIQTIEQWGDISWQSMFRAFSGCSNLQLLASDQPDLSSLTDLSYMFLNATTFDADISNWDVSSVINMRGMFDGAISYNNGNQPLNWANTSLVENMSFMFTLASGFNQDISGWDVAAVTNMRSMFAEASSFNNGGQPLSWTNTGLLDNAQFMFFNATSFDQSLGGWDISSITNMANMLDNTAMTVANYDATLIGWEAQSPPVGLSLGANNLEYCLGETARNDLISTFGWTINGDVLNCPISQPFITTWQTDNAGSSNVDQVTIPTTGAGYNYDIYWEEVGNPTNNGTEPVGQTGDYTITFPSPGTYRVEISGAFPRIYFNAASFNPDKDSHKLLTVEQWGTNAWTSMAAAFSGCVNLQISATDAPNLSLATSMQRMFYDATSMNSDINNWDVSTITDMQELFRDAEAFNQPLNNWNVSNVTTMRFMFFWTKAFNQDIGSWNVSNVTNMNLMFAGADVFNQPLGSWNMSSVTNTNQMFSNALAFNQDISGWDMSNVTDIRSMFSGAAVFNQNISSWTVNATNFTNLFKEAAAFNQDLSTWNVSAVIDMESTFNGAAAFNQDLSSWNVNNVTDMRSMFANTSYNQDITTWDVGSVFDFNGMFQNNTAFNQDISGWDVTFATDMRQMFSGATSFNQNLGGWNVANLNLAVNMLNNSGLSIENYDDLLIGWSALALRSNVSFGASGLNYCAGAAARDLIVTNFNWTINDNGQRCISTYVGPDILGIEIFNAQADAVNLGSGQQGVGKTQQFTIQNELIADITNLSIVISGTAFNIVQPSITITSGGTLTFDAVLLGTVAGNFTETISITSDNFTDPFVFDITAGVTVGPEPEIEIFHGISTADPLIPDGDAFGLAMGSEVRGTDLVDVFTIQNIGSADLSITDFSIPDAAFTLDTSAPLVVPVGGIVNVFITLEGTLGLDYVTTLEITSNDADETVYDFPVLGSIEGPEILAFNGPDRFFEPIFDNQATPVDLGASTLGSDLVAQITLTNDGPIPLDVSTLNITGTAFSVSPLPPFTIGFPMDGIYDEWVLDITLDGSTKGVFTETITITSDDDQTPVFTFDITGSIAAPPHIYWTENIGEITGDDEIHRTDLDGSNFSRYYSGFSDEISGIVIDTAGNRLYWTDAAKARILTGEIGSGSFALGPSLVIDFNASSTSALVDLALDLANGHIYFTHGDAEFGFTNKIARVNLDGTNYVELIDIGFFEKPFGIDLDLTNNKIYFTTNLAESGFAGRLYRANLDGTNVEELAIIGDLVVQTLFTDVKIDVANNMVYWATGEPDLPGVIYYNDLTEAAPYAAPSSFATTGEIRGLDLDPINNKLYWMCRGANAGTIPAAIMRSDLDGNNKEGVFTVTLYPPSYPSVPAGSAFIALDLRGVTATPVCASPPTATAGADATICEGTTYALSGSIGGSASTLSWTTSGDGSFDDDTSPTAVYTPGTTDLSTGSVNLTITTDDPDATGPCLPASDDLILTIEPLPIINAIADINLCSVAPVLLSASIGGTASGVDWTTNGDGNFDDNLLLTPTYTLGASDITNGTVTLTVTTTGTGNCLAVNDQVIITISPPTVNAGPDQTVCESTTATLNGSFGGAASSVSWTSAGDGNFDDNTNPAAVYTPGPNDLVNGTVTLTLATDDPDGPGPCLSVSDDIILTIEPLPTISAGPDITVCTTAAVPLAAVIGGSATGVSWTSSGDGIFDDALSLTPNYTPGTTDIANGVFTVTVVTTGSGTCLPVNDQVIISIDPPTVDAGLDQVICASDNAQLNSTFGGAATSILWATAGDGSFDDPTLAAAVYTPGTLDLANGQVSLTVTTDDPDGAGPCLADSDEVIISFSQPISVIDQSTSLNVNETGTIDVLNGATTNPGDILSTSISVQPQKGVAVVNPDGSIDYTPSSGNSGTDSFEFTVCNQCGLCNTAMATITIINEPPVVNVPPANGQAGGTVQVDVLSGITDINGNIDLSSLAVIIQPLSGASANFDANGNLLVDYTEVNFTGTDQLTIEVCDFDGLCTQEIITIEIAEPAVSVYNAVSPNGDGKHDYLEIEGIEFYTSSRVIVMNRWGDIVYQVNGYDNNNVRFEGLTSNGGELPSGTYYYQIDLGDGSAATTGYFSLRR